MIDERPTDRSLLRRDLFVPVAAVVGVALLCRLAVAAVYESRLSADRGRRFVVAGDAEGYWELAGRLAAGAPYAVHDPPRRVMRMPGLPLLLAAVRLMSGDRPAVARVVLAAAGAAACGLVVLVGERLAGREAGIVAGGLTAVSPLLAAFGPLLLSETLFTVAMVAAVAVTREAIVATRSAVPLAVAAGTLHAAATLVRPTWVIAAPVITAGWFAVSAYRGEIGKALPAAAALLLAFAAGMAPWAIRNAVVVGRPITTTLWAGPSLYDGLNPGATGASDMTFFDADALPRRMGEAEVNREYTRRAIAFAVANPGRVVELAVVKLGRFWNPFLNASGFAGGPLGWAVGLFEISFFVAAAIGLWARRGDLGFLAITCGPVLFFAAVHALFVGSVRYRVPGEYLLAIPAAVGVLAILPAGLMRRLGLGGALS